MTASTVDRGTVATDPTARTMRPRRTRPRYRYNPSSGIVHIRGRDMVADLRAMKSALEGGRIPISITALAYERPDSNVTVLMTGDHLSEWIIANWVFPLSIFYSSARDAIEARQ